MRVGRLSSGSTVVLLRLSCVEILGRTINTSGDIGVKRWIRTRRLTRRRQIVTTEAVLVECLGESIFKHSVVISHSRLELGMQVEKSILNISVTVLRCSNFCNSPCLLIVSPYVRANFGRSVPMLS